MYCHDVVYHGKALKKKEMKGGEKKCKKDIWKGWWASTVKLSPRNQEKKEQV